MSTKGVHLATVNQILADPNPTRIRSQIRLNKEVNQDAEKVKIQEETKTKVAKTVAQGALHQAKRTRDQNQLLLTKRRLLLEKPLEPKQKLNLRERLVK